MKRMNKKGQNVLVALLLIVAEFLIFFIGYPALSSALNSFKTGLTDPILLLIYNLIPFIILMFIFLQLFFILRFGRG